MQLRQALNSLPIWLLAAFSAVLAGTAYYLVIWLLEVLFGGVINLIFVLLTLGAILFPVAVVARSPRFKTSPGWAKPFVLLAVLVGGFIIWFAVVGSLSDACGEDCWD